MHQSSIPSALNGGIAEQVTFPANVTVDVAGVVVDCEFDWESEDGKILDWEFNLADKALIIFDLKFDCEDEGEIILKKILSQFRILSKFSMRLILLLILFRFCHKNGQFL